MAAIDDTKSETITTASKTDGEHVTIAAVRKTSGLYLVDHVVADSATYRTKHTIDRRAQARYIGRRSLLSHCLPCCFQEGRCHKSAYQLGTCVRDWLQSVALPVIISIVVLSLGVTKEALDLRQSNPDLHKACTIIETCSACLHVIMQSVYIATCQSQSRRINLQLISKSTKLTKDRFEPWIKTYLVFAITILVLIISCYFLFLHILHHGWTVLSNNLCLILMTTTTTIYSRRINYQISLLKEDELLLALLEALHLLEESRGANALGSVFVAVEEFKQALQRSDLFKVPRYIQLRRKGSNFHNNVVHQADLETGNI